MTGPCRVAEHPGMRTAADRYESIYGCVRAELSLAGSSDALCAAAATATGMRPYGSTRHGTVCKPGIDPDWAANRRPR